MITLAAIINTMIYSTLLVLFLWIITKNEKSLRVFGVSFILLPIFIIQIRLFFPVEFPFSRVMYSDVMIPAFYRFAHQSIFDILSIKDFLTLAYLSGFAYRTLKAIRDYYCIKKSVSHLEEYMTRDVFKTLNVLKKEKSLPDNLKIISSSITSVPLTFGVLKPIIILPQREYTKEKLYFILKHELQHHYKHDTLKKLLAEFMCSIYWCYPVVSVWFRRLYFSILEYNADLAVSKTLTDCERIRYLECILEFSKSASVSELTKSSLGFQNNNFDEKKLTKRFQVVLNHEQYVSKPHQKVISTILSIIVLMVSFTFYVQGHHDQPSNNDSSFVLEGDEAYIIQYGKGNYVIYRRNNEELASVTSIHDSFANLPIYKKNKKGNDKVKLKQTLIMVLVLLAFFTNSSGITAQATV